MRNREKTEKRDHCFWARRKCYYVAEEVEKDDIEVNYLPLFLL